MRFGLLYSLQSRPDKPATQAQIYREMLEEIEAGEVLGFDSAWLVEHHFLADGLCPSPLVAAAAMAARTRRMTIGTSMYLLPLHRPVQSAEDVAVLDNLANGRIILGVAAGYRPEEFAGYEEERSGREQRMEEQLDIMIKAWTTESFSYDGRYYKIPQTSVTPKPVQKPRPPIWIGASTRGGVRRAAQWADALVASPRHHIAELKQHFAMYGEYLQRFGKHPSCVPVIREVYCAPTTATGRSRGARRRDVYPRRNVWQVGGREAAARRSRRVGQGSGDRHLREPSRALHHRQPRSLRARDKALPE